MIGLNLTGKKRKVKVILVRCNGPPKDVILRRITILRDFKEERGTTQRVIFPVQLTSDQRSSAWQHQLINS